MPRPFLPLSALGAPAASLATAASRVSRALAAGALFAALGACANDAAEIRADELAETIQERQIAHFARTFALETPVRAVTLAEHNANAPSIQALVEQGRLEFESDATVRELVTLLFAERDYDHLFVLGGRLTPDGRAVLDALNDAPTHGLDRDAMHGALVDELVADLAAAGDTEAIIAQFELDEDDEDALRAFMTENAGLDGSVPAQDALFSVLAGDRADNPVPRIADAIDALTARMELGAESGPQLELVLAAAFVRYAVANRHANLGYVSAELAEERGWDLEDEAQRPQIERALAGASFREASERGFDAVLGELQPPFEQYRRLLDGVREYRAYVEAGGWEPLEVRGVLRAGDDGDEVLALRRRLHAENYFDGDLDDPEFDEPLRQAVLSYQRSHQLTEDGEVSGSTLSSMNVPAERRLAQVLMGLDFWRTTKRAEHAGAEHIWVNVPDFYAELWDVGERVHRWRVVVGRGTGQRQPNGEIRGRTPLFSDVMQYLVFNPYWNVPDSIRREEYDHLIEADPMWLADNGFELAFEAGREWLRQMPGPGNALGRVKFLFPNSHDVYMHDTPSRSLFSRATRAFSHGCVRVHDPLLLASILLQRDRGWSERRTERYIEEQLETGIEQWVSLIRPIPIHIEYVSVRGGDDGRIEFLADPYRYDRPRVDARLAALGYDVGGADDDE